MANPLAGLTGLGSAEVRIEPEPAVAIHLAAEVITVGRAAATRSSRSTASRPSASSTPPRAAGLAELLAEMAAERASAWRGGRPSLLQDVMRGRRTEIEYLNGAVLRRGQAPRRHARQRRGRDIVLALHSVGALKPDPRNLEPITAVLPR